MDIDDFSFFYGEKQIIDQLNAKLYPGEFMCIVGPSGVGKTTLLQCLSGLRMPTHGSITFDGKTITGPPRSLAVVFQDYAHSLMPWLSSLSNVALPLKSAGVSKKERKQRAAEALAQVGLEGNELKYPWQLSGGQQQRVAIARALACRPRVIIMDEPFASVDAQTRADLEDLAIRVRNELGVAIILVTHDIDEAVYLSDKIMVLTGHPSSGKPARLVEMVDVPFGTERDQIETKSTKAFAELRSRVYAQIRKKPEEM
ncbi:ABC transporter ATP-binding protein [Glutamicibacter arilaitensis]|uniref:ABC transporter ATP-binding protein n=1 Tax=Glutamicibacter arilaitensis TaxID=256701 RepID=UPI00385056F1